MCTILHITINNRRAPALGDLLSDAECGSCWTTSPCDQYSTLVLQLLELVGVLERRLAMGSNNANRRGPLHGRIQIRKFLACWAALFLLLLASAASASATTFTLTYNDLNDTPNLTLNGAPVPCTTQVGEQCVIQIPTTAAAHVTATTLQNFTHWAEPGTGGLLCADGNLGPCISDALNSNAKAVLAAAQLAVPLYLPLQFVFMSDPPGATEPVGLPACSITPDKCL